jgi:hypothetical protein
MTNPSATDSQNLRAADFMMRQNLLTVLAHCGFEPEAVDDNTIIATLYEGATYELTFKRRTATSGDVELTDEVMDGLAEEAEEGYDVKRLRPRERSS